MHILRILVARLLLALAARLYRALAHTPLPYPDHAPLGSHLLLHSKVVGGAGLISSVMSTRLRRHLPPMRGGREFCEVAEDAVHGDR